MGGQKVVVITISEHLWKIAGTLYGRFALTKSCRVSVACGRVQIQSISSGPHLNTASFSSLRASFHTGVRCAYPDTNSIPSKTGVNFASFYREVPQLASFSHGQTATLAFSDVVQIQNFGSLNVSACPFLHDRLWKHSVSCNALDDFSFDFRNSPALITGCCYSWWLHEKFSKFVFRQHCAALQVGNVKEKWICKINDKVHIF